MRYLIEPRERRYVKRYGFMSFAKNFSDKYSKSLTYVLVMSRNSLLEAGAKSEV